MGYFFSFASLSKSATSTALDISEITLLLSGFVLAVGAVGEYLEDHKRLPRFMTWPKVAFEVMVALSLAGELIADGGVFLFSHRLQTINDGEYAALNKEAGDARRDAGIANKEAGIARKEAGGANERAARANETAEREHLARVRLEIRLSPRSLSTEQKSRLITALRSASGDVRIDIIMLGNTPEISNITESVADALRQAGWNVNVLKAIDGPSYSGFLVSMKRGFEALIASNAGILIRALSSVDLAEVSMSNPFGEGYPFGVTGNINAQTIANVAPLRMLVGTKP